MKPYIEIKKPKNCSDCDNWNCKYAKPKIPKNCPIVWMSDSEVANMIKENKNNISDNERLKLLLLNYVKGIDVKAFKKNKNVYIADDIIELIKQIK